MATPPSWKQNRETMNMWVGKSCEPWCWQQVGIYLDPEHKKTNLTPFTGSSLTYDMNSLTWDVFHFHNSQNMYCYCGKGRSQTIMYRCNKCQQWFHEECLKNQEDRPNWPVEGDPHYQFQCALCSPTKREICEIVAKNWVDMARIALYNMRARSLQNDSTPRRFFHYSSEICQFIEQNFQRMNPGGSLISTWKNSVSASLTTRPNVFLSGTNHINSAGYWAMVDDVNPYFERDFPNLVSKPKAKKKEKVPRAEKPPSEKKSKKKSALKEKEESLPKEKKIRKKMDDRKKKAALLKKKSSFWIDFYYDPVYYPFQSVMLIPDNSAPQLKDLITEAGTVATNPEGYCMARSSFGAKEGTWFFEVRIKHNIGEGNVRIGFATERALAQANVGFDKYGYGYRDKQGTKFHQAKPEAYGEGYQKGDVIGCLISIPREDNIPFIRDPSIFKEAAENPDDEPEWMKPLPEPYPTKGYIEFFKNGKSQGIAFENIFSGTWYAAVSMFQGGRVKCNFGPDFSFPPPSSSEWKPFSDLPKQSYYIKPDPDDLPIEIKGNKILVKDIKKQKIEEQPTSSKDQPISDSMEIISPPPVPETQNITAPFSKKLSVASTPSVSLPEKQRPTKKENITPPVTKKKNNPPAFEKQNIKETATEKQTIKESATEKQTIKEPVTEKQTIKEPVTEKQTIKEPVTEKQNIKEPVAEKQTVQKPATEKQNIKEPVAEKQTVQKPATEKQTIKEPVTEKQNIKEPVTEKQTIKEPATEKQNIKEPVTEKQNASPQISEKQDIPPASEKQKIDFQASKPTAEKISSPERATSPPPPKNSIFNFINAPQNNSANHNNSNQNPTK